MSRLLTFELDEKNELLEIHGNNEGLLYLKQQIESLILVEELDHVHMMVPSWGGEELSEERQCEQNQIVPHIKIYKWKD